MRLRVEVTEWAIFSKYDAGRLGANHPNLVVDTASLNAGETTTECEPMSMDILVVSNSLSTEAEMSATQFALHLREEG